METIRIAHLYYDLLNLYGESGNVKALFRHLEQNKVKVIIHNLTVEEDIDFSKYDIIYMGSGNKEAIEIARQDLLKRKKEIKKAWKKGTFFLITGNALDLFGKTYTTLEEEQKEMLGFLNFDVKEIDFRIIGETKGKSDMLKEEIIGFQNRYTIMQNVEEPCFYKLDEKTGYEPNVYEEGIKKEHFFGTYTLGPLFIRNPFLTEKIIQEILESKSLPYYGYEDTFAIKAYREYMKNFYETK